MRRAESGSGDLVLLGPEGDSDDRSWIVKASYVRVGAGHVRDSDTTGALVTEHVRDLARAACTVSLAASASLNSLFGGEAAACGLVAVAVAVCVAAATLCEPYGLPCSPVLAVLMSSLHSCTAPQLCLRVRVCL